MLKVVEVLIHYGGAKHSNQGTGVVTCTTHPVLMIINNLFSPVQYNKLNMAAACIKWSVHMERYT